MRDLGAEHVQALAHECGEAGPALGGDHVAVDIGLGGLDVDIDAADGRHFGLARTETGDLLALQHAGYRHQDLHAMADREDRLAGLMEMADHVLHALVGADIFRAPAAGCIDRVIFLDSYFREGLVDVGIVAELFRIGLVAFEIVQRGFRAKSHIHHREGRLRHFASA